MCFQTAVTNGPSFKVTNVLVSNCSYHHRENHQQPAAARTFLCVFINHLSKQPYWTAFCHAFNDSRCPEQLLFPDSNCKFPSRCQVHSCNSVFKVAFMARTLDLYVVRAVFDTCPQLPCLFHSGRNTNWDNHPPALSPISSLVSEKGKWISPLLGN